MLANVIGSYLDSLEEREFDAPFMALLRALGFRDIHLLHGAFEFGKDFIAKFTERLWKPPFWVIGFAVTSVSI